MSFRRRTVLLAASAVAAAIVIASVVVYVVTRNELLGQIDSSLRQKPQSVMFANPEARTELAKLGREGRVAAANAELARLKREGRIPPGANTQLSVKVQSSGMVVGEAAMRVTGQPHGGAGSFSAGPSPTSAPNGATVKALPAPGSQPQLRLPAAALGGATGYVQLYRITGQLLHSGSQPGLLLPVTAVTRAVAQGRRPAFFSDVTVGGTPVRMFTEQAGTGAVWQAALPLSDFDSTLSHLRLVLALVCLGGALLAVALGAARLARRAGARAPPDRRRRTGRPHTGSRSPREGRQRRRPRPARRRASTRCSPRSSARAWPSASSSPTPPTSCAPRSRACRPTSTRSPSASGSASAERARIVAAVQAQLSELTVLVGGPRRPVQDRSRGDRSRGRAPRPGRRGGAANERACTPRAAASHSTPSRPWCAARPARLDRAIANLLDNACQWTPSPRAGPIEVRVREGTLRGARPRPGDRRGGSAARVRPLLPRARRPRTPRLGARTGNRQAPGRDARRHVHAANAPGGGALLTLELPAVAMTAAELAACAPVGVLHQAPRLL